MVKALADRLAEVILKSFLYFCSQSKINFTYQTFDTGICRKTARESQKKTLGDKQEGKIKCLRFAQNQVQGVIFHSYLW